MAKKPFEIQDSRLRIGGVDLQAGTTGVVIPGVTQATNYTVEEVEEDGDYDVRPSYNAQTVVVIDHAQWNFYSGILTPSPQYVAAQYIVELDDGEIDEFSVDVEGIFSDAERSIAHGRDQANQNQNWDLWPFRYWVAAEQVPTSICTLIFTQNHWQQVGGSWD